MGTVELMSNAPDAIRDDGTERLTGTRQPETVSRNASLGVRPPVEQYPDMFIMSPRSMAAGHLYPFEIAGQPMVAVKQPEGGVRIYYFAE